MYEENKNQATKSNKKYIALAIVVILGAIGIMMNSGSEEKTTTSISKVTSTKQAPVSEEASASEEQTTARIDILAPLVNVDEPQFEVYLDDSDEPLQQPGWMTKLGYQGVVVQKEGHEGIITIRVLSDAEIRIVLRGPDKRDENNQTVENWVDYTSVQVNGEEILPETIAVWHNKPFRHIINAKAGDDIIIAAEWQKHSKE